MKLKLDVSSINESLYWETKSRFYSLGIGAPTTYQEMIDKLFTPIYTKLGTTSGIQRILSDTYNIY